MVAYTAAMPSPDEPAHAPPPILISDLYVAGSRQSISALDETEILLPDLAVDQNQLQIDFVGLSFAPGDVLRYQYKVEGADKDWSAPTERRSVTYRLAPGRYRFFVRAVNSDGVVSSSPAAVTFRILPPLWERWWFLALIAIGLTSTLYRLYRYRVARLMELERVRTRIASDLHDDIGANLSLIAGLSDVLRQQAPSSDPQVSERLSLIASVSRRSVDAMSDIVWAINPNRDLAGLAFLRGLPEVDARRIAVVGDSFGGSLTVLEAERDSAVRAAVVFSCAGYSWDKSPQLRARLLAAVDRAAPPIFFIHAENDLSLAPGKALDAELRRLRKSSRLKIYPPVGESAEDGHAFLYLRVSSWEPDVFAFLGEHMRGRIKAVGRN